MKPKKKVRPDFAKTFKNSKLFKKKVRKSGYYVVKYPGERKMSIAEYVPKDKCWYFTGVIFRYFDNELSYISPTPITLRNPVKKGITIPVTRSGHVKPKPRKK